MEERIREIIEEFLDDKFYTLQEIKEKFPQVYEEIRKEGIRDEEQWEKVFWETVLLGRKE